MNESVFFMCLLLAAGILPGCGSDADGSLQTVRIGLEEYDQSCTSDSDCVSVAASNECACSCEKETIRASELDRFNQEQGAQCDKALECAPCPDAPPPVCDAGRCSLP